MSLSRLLSGVFVIMAVVLSGCSTEGRSYSSSSYSGNSASANASYTGDSYSNDSSMTLSYSEPEVRSGN